MVLSMQRLRRDRSGATAIEYGLIAGLIALAMFVAVKSVGTNLSGVFNTVSTKVSTAAA